MTEDTTQATTSTAPENGGADPAQDESPDAGPGTGEGGPDRVDPDAPDENEAWTDGASVPDPETAVREGESAAAVCEYCGRPFRTQRQHDLHLGHAHEGIWTDAQREAYEDAVDAESEELWVFHMKVVVALGLIYAAFVLSYTVVVSA